MWIDRNLLSFVRNEVRTHKKSPSIVEGVAVGRGSNIKNKTNPEAADAISGFIT